METAQQLTAEAPETAREKWERERKERRDRYFAYIATFMKGCPAVSGERLRKLKACCPPKQYRKAAA